MNDFSLKNVIDRELEEIKLSDSVKKNIRKGVVHRKSYPIIKSIAASIAVIVPYCSKIVHMSPSES